MYVEEKLVHSVTDMTARLKVATILSEILGHVARPGKMALPF
jgi:hypothetical protein